MNAATIKQGYQDAERLTRQHARSFSFASHALFGHRRKAAFALYAFCRRADDAVDLVADPAGRVAALASFKDGLERVMEKEDPRSLELSWTVPERAAFMDTVQRYQLRLGPFVDLLAGLEMDLTQSRYSNWRDLDLYCYRVAGTVGLMMAPVLGCASEWALEHAVDLGKAMQLTNILRDVREDYELGRIYLPQEELAAFGVSEDDLAVGRVTPGFVELMRFQIERARALYVRGAKGIRELHARGAPTMVRLMGGVYGAILEEIEGQGFDVFVRRAKVPWQRKLKIAWRVLSRPQPLSVQPSPALPELPSRKAA